MTARSLIKAFVKEDRPGAARRPHPRRGGAGASRHGGGAATDSAHDP